MIKLGKFFTSFVINKKDLQEEPIKGTSNVFRNNEVYIKDIYKEDVVVSLLTNDPDKYIEII